LTNVCSYLNLYVLILPPLQVSGGNVLIRICLCDC